MVDIRLLFFAPITRKISLIAGVMKRPFRGVRNRMARLTDEPSGDMSSARRETEGQTAPDCSRGGRSGFHALLLVIIALFCPIMLSACSDSADKHPNVLFIVWDTTRADRLSLYGYEKPTTPFLEKWAGDAMVFDNCTSTACSTTPSHAAMFTGLLPSEHGANNSFSHLDDRHTTLAEIFKSNGYQTYLFAANPHISFEENFNQGFDTEEHPWDDRYIDRAMKILRDKIDPRDRSSEIQGRMRSKNMGKWSIKACGELAEEGLFEWLEKRDSDKPFFAFLNYMEAHRPFIPPLDYRRRFMNPQQVNRSFYVDRSWQTMWRYSFGLHEYKPFEIRLMASTYDACIAELDDLFRNLITSLDKKGFLDNTIVVLTSDHGEHLGEHHMLDHQYSLYEGLLRVPLILHYPGKVKPGRVEMPVVNFDIFPTLLELADLKRPADLPQRTVSLLSPEASRTRLAEYPSALEAPLNMIKDMYSGWDPAPFRRNLTALYQGDHKLIWASDGRHELYDLAVDPAEEKDLSSQSADAFNRLLKEYLRIKENLLHFDYSQALTPEMSPEQIERLMGLGYSDGKK